MNWIENLTLRYGIAINAGWVTLASLMSVSVALKRFRISFPGKESLWGVLTLTMAAGIYIANSVLGYHFAFTLVFVYACFSLFLKYNMKHSIFIFLYLII